MPLSDELLQQPDRLAQIRTCVETLTEELGAESSFLVDEAGCPFAAVGHIEFPLPHPLAGATDDGGVVLKALLGEAPPEDGSRYLVAATGHRALIVCIMETPLEPPARKRLEKRLEKSTRALKRLLS